MPNAGYLSLWSGYLIGEEEALQDEINTVTSATLPCRSKGFFKQYLRVEKSFNVTFTPMDR